MHPEQSTATPQSARQSAGLASPLPAGEPAARPSRPSEHFITEWAIPHGADAPRN